MTETLTTAAVETVLAGQIGEERFRLWFADKSAFRHDGTQLIVGVPNRFCQEWLQNKFAAEVAAAAAAAYGRPTPVRFVIDPALFQAQRAEQARAAAAPKPAPQPVPAQAAAPKGGGRRWRTLAEFQVGPCNRLAHAAVLNLIQAPDLSPTPVVLHGPSGTGKSHLLEAVYLELRKAHPDGNVLLVTGEEFLNRFQQALYTRQMGTFRQTFRGATALLVDDVHFLAGKDASQEEFLHTFEALQRQGRTVVLTSACHPKLLPQLPPELTDRLLGGGVWALEALDAATRLAVLRSRGPALGCPLPEDAARFLADHLRGNVRELEGALHAVRHYAQVHGKPLSQVVAKEATAHLIKQAERAVQLADVERAVGAVLEVNAKELRGPSRARAASYPRMLAMYLARKHGGASYSDIGRYFGGRNHSTVIAGEKKVKGWLAAGETLFLADRKWKAAELIERLERELMA